MSKTVLYGSKIQNHSVDKIYPNFYEGELEMRHYFIVVFCILLIAIGTNASAYDSESTDQFPSDQGSNEQAPSDGEFPSDKQTPSDSRTSSGDQSLNNQDSSQTGGTLEVSGTGFSEWAGQPITIISYPDNVIVDSYVVNGTSKVENAAFFDGIILSDGTFENEFGSEYTLNLVDESNNPVALSNGNYILLIIIDKEPAMKDPNRSDIGGNDLVALMSATIDGDTTIQINSESLLLIPFSDL
jgi:hypothetical protein